MPDTDELTYLVLADRAVPYLLARVRWPDVAQAISARSPGWLEDPGLFDLPYDPSAIAVSFPQAASVAAGWGRQLHAGAAEDVPSYMRRMPANWSDLSPSERRAWGIESVGRRHPRPRRARGRRASQAKTVAEADGRIDVLAVAGGGAGVDAPAVNGSSQVAHVTSGLGSIGAEHRLQMRVRVDGKAHIRVGRATISAGLVDLSEGGVRCVLPGTPSALAPGVWLPGPFLLEADATTWRICLELAGQISWQRNTEAGTQFGVVFDRLDEGETEGVQRFLAAACRRGGSP
jgi:PilZ domain